MCDYDSSLKLFIIICISSVFGFGYIIGFKMEEQFSQQETINFCVEQPSACGVKYDYYKVEARK